MLTTGNQMKAARALAGMDQVTLAKAAKISTGTVSAMEGRGAEMLTSALGTVRSVMIALEATGIEFLDKGPGVKLRAKQTPER